MTLAIHILAGSLALVFGYVALFARKGAKLHRTSGALFVYAILVMAIAGLLIAAIRGVAPAINIPMALLASYLVVTALVTVRPFTAGVRWIHLGSVALALGIGVTDLAFGLEVLARGGRADMPAPPLLVFGGIALMAAGGDFRILRSGPLQGTPRLVRHLWRMCLALLIAAFSFFIGQSDEFPETIRIMPLLVLPPLLVLAAMIYWRWRIRDEARWRLRAD